MHQCTKLSVTDHDIHVIKTFTCFPTTGPFSQAVNNKFITDDVVAQKEDTVSAWTEKTAAQCTTQPSQTLLGF